MKLETKRKKRIRRINKLFNYTALVFIAMMIAGPILYSMEIQEGAGMLFLGITANVFLYIIYKWLNKKWRSPKKSKRLRS